jgi:hypothetical protein
MFQDIACRNNGVIFFTDMNCCIKFSPLVSSIGGCLFVRFAIGGGVNTIASSRSESESTTLQLCVSETESIELSASDSDIAQVLLL